MEVVLVLLALALEGLVIGALARFALPGRDPMSLFETIAVGLGGSLLGGVVTFLLTDGRQAPSFFAAFVFSVLIMYLVRRRRGGGLTSPGAVEERV